MLRALIEWNCSRKKKKNLEFEEKSTKDDELVVDSYVYHVYQQKMALYTNRMDHI
jgi:hypothetical protein